VVQVQPHAQPRAQRPPGQANLDPPGTEVLVALDRPAQDTAAQAQFAVLPGELPGFQRCHPCPERHMHDPPERRGAGSRAYVRARVVVLAVAGIAAYVSYWHAYAVVKAHGETRITAQLEPATIDGLVMPVRWWCCPRPGTGPRSRLWPLAARPGDRGDPHGEHGPGLVPRSRRAVVAAWPAVSLVSSYEVLAWLIRTSGAVERGPSAEHLWHRAARGGISSLPVSVIDGDRRGGCERHPSDPARRPAGQAARLQAIPASGQRDDEGPDASTVKDAAVAAYRLSVQAGNRFRNAGRLRCSAAHRAAGRGRESLTHDKHHRSKTRRAGRPWLDWRRWRANSEP
jgi:hypothetical protein